MAGAVLLRRSPRENLVSLAADGTSWGESLGSERGVCVDHNESGVTGWGGVVAFIQGGGHGGHFRSLGERERERDAGVGQEGRWRVSSGGHGRQGQGKRGCCPLFAPLRFSRTKEGRES